jgi:hypothetical protein
LFLVVGKVGRRGWEGAREVEQGKEEGKEERAVLMQG